MNLSRVKAVLFDLDGTLMDTLSGLTTLVNDMLVDFGKAPLSQEKIGCYIGRGVPKLIHRAMTDNLDGEIDSELYGRALECFQKHVQEGKFDKGVLFADTVNSLERLKRHHYRMVVVTNKPYHMTIPQLRTHGILDYFEFVVGGDSAPRAKPWPDPINLALEKLELSPHEAVMVGDSQNDSGAALAADCPCLLVQTGYSEGIPLERIRKTHHVNAIFNSMTEVVDHLLLKASQ